MDQLADMPRRQATDPRTDARTVEVESDVTDAVDLGEQCRLRGTVFVPATGAGPGPRPVLVAVPGGTYTRRYWHLVVPGRAGYSFAEDFARRGVVVVAFDNLGTGASTRPSGGDRLTPEVIARANHAAARDVIDRPRRSHSSMKLS
ncbi:hypothetical protein FRACA_2890011 [Frankia canadensis]|uniref:Uncharacterized protein n=1 Tax=Frankia canadensis TaxID=1836972 RepID=A0A2I2KT88_9ACTN|nr:hypothetical protein [Frankia canadensis]SNQ48888.1 hypothetical protein FRACA_2890011 [Frankia canadensis]SOU56178.1 hypothetical protein FRACA_2890011 [Frankia canadensis]